MTNISASHCHVCNTVFSFENRDIFAGEVFCPACASRTAKSARFDSLQLAVNKHPKASIYGVKKAVAR